MNRDQARFLYSLPLVIHIPSEHVFLAHAGLLPYDPRKSSDDKSQPLAHTPSADEEDGEDDSDDDYEYPTVDTGSWPRWHLDEGTDELRALQEHALLEDIPHNRDPWVILNIRSIRKDGTVTRNSNKGTPWAKVWNGQMKRCAGFAGEADVTAGASSVDSLALADERDDKAEKEKEEKELPCYPSTVVYGHAASRDLDVRRWTLGLDTGCLYGRRLTALVLTREQGEDAWVPTRVLPTDDEDDGDDNDEDDMSSDDDDGEETVLSMGGSVNSRYARVAGGSAISRRAKRPKTWTRTIKFGDKHSDLGATLVSVKCPKVGDLA